jgi:hypothetical protein
MDSCQESDTMDPVPPRAFSTISPEIALNVSIDIQGSEGENEELLVDVDVPERIPDKRPWVPCLIICLMGGLCLCLTFLLFLYCYFHSRGY